MFRRWFLCGGALALAACFCGPARAAGDYATDLGVLLGEHERVLAEKEACISAYPAGRSQIEKAYQDWHDRHEDLLEDLETRFAAMIKQASHDQKEYSRNFGRYQGAVMRQRQEHKQVFLAQPKQELVAQCKALPDYLRSPKSNIPDKYPAEFRTVYGKK